MMSPLQLDRYFLKGLCFNLNEGYDRGRVSPDRFAAPQIEIGVISAEQDPERPSHWRFEVSLGLSEMPESDFPYHVETTLVGYFIVHDNYPPQHAERLARANGPAVLYSCAREIVASITGRSPYPKLLIPSVTFVQPERVEEAPGHPELPFCKPMRLTEGKGGAEITPSVGRREER